ncbi:PD40 domain-containing protein [bacterium]|nr:PD40 domain-containing protein [bacterium]
MIRTRLARATGSRMLGLCLLTTALLLMGCNDQIVGGGPSHDPGDVYPPHHETPAWSAGGLIAYRDNGFVPSAVDTGTYDVDEDLVGIWVLNPDTGVEEHILAGGKHPDWSPDGSRFLVVSGGRQLWTVNSDGSGEEQLTFSGRNLYPDWSPDASMVAWHRTDGDDQGLWLMRSTGDSQRAVLNRGYYPDWSPTGDELLCAGWTGGIHGLLEYSISTGTVTFLATDDSDGGVTSLQPTYSPNGSQIAFTRHCVGDLYQVWVMESDGTGSRQLTWDGATDPAWSPDGECVVYTRENWQSNAPEDGVLWIVDVETGEQRQLTHKRGEEVLRQRERQ